MAGIHQRRRHAQHGRDTCRRDGTREVGAVPRWQHTEWLLGPAGHQQKDRKAAGGRWAGYRAGPSENGRH